MPKISVIIPIYNTIKYLEQAIQSVISQTFADFELILIDDGSTDGSGKMADEYASIDSRIIVLHELKSGVAVARNNAVDLAKGEYLVFLDSDDYFSNSNAFALILEKVQMQRSDIVFYGYADLDMNTNKTRLSQIGFEKEKFALTKTDWLKYIYDSDFFPTACWQLAVRREFVEKYCIRFPERVLCEDIDWGIKVLYYAKSYSYVDCPLLTYRRNRIGSIMDGRGLQHLQGCLLAVREWLDIPQNDRYLGLTNFVAHMYGYIFSYFMIIPKEQRKTAEIEMKKYDKILIESDKWNHHLIYYTQRLLGVMFTSGMICIVYKLFYAPESIFGSLRKKYNEKNI